MGTNRDEKDELIEDLIHLEDEEGKTADDLDLLRPVDIFVAFKFLWLDKNGNEYPANDDIYEQVLFLESQGKIKYAGHNSQIGEGWEKFKYPFTDYGILKYLDTLSQLEFAGNDCLNVGNSLVSFP